MIPSLLIILPCYNEEEVIESSIIRLKKLLNKMLLDNLISDRSKLLFVDDGSVDNTWNLISKNSINLNIKGIKLSRNFGHQNAILSALLENINKYDLYITVDVDLQDDIEIIPNMINSYLKGNEIVYGVRDDRQSDSLFKRKSASLFYKFQKNLGINIIENHADFRLISNKILNELTKYKEINLFLRAIFPLIGYKSENIYYKRHERTAGETKYTFFKMLKFAGDGITSFSIKPLRLILLSGSLIFIISFLMSLWILLGTLFTGDTVPGWASTVLPIYFIGGIQLLSIGILGEYIGKIYIESKARPRYTIEKVF